MTNLKKLQLRIEARSTVNMSTDCWEWSGTLRGGKYGTISIDNRAVMAHRASYAAFVAPVPAHLEVDHLCRNTICVNPEHLQPVTPGENRKRQGEAVTHCPKGHEYTESNTLLNPRKGLPPTRRCRTCTNEKNRLARIRRMSKKSSPSQVE